MHTAKDETQNQEQHNVQSAKDHAHYNFRKEIRERWHGTRLFHLQPSESSISSEASRCAEERCTHYPEGAIRRNEIRSSADPADRLAPHYQPEQNVEHDR